jgi:hypothetical protein
MMSAHISRVPDNESRQFNLVLFEVFGQRLPQDRGVVEVVLEAVFGQSALEVICNSECDVVILNLTHVVFFGGRTPSASEPAVYSIEAPFDHLQPLG